jgi:Holliday junction resolvasome RuvABC endonuclease subunit
MSLPGAILVLDLATTTGWAVWRPGQGSGPYHGLLRMPKGTIDLGYFVERFREQVADLIKVYQPELVAFELPFIGANISQDSARKLMGLATFCEWICYRLRIECVEVNNSTWRKHFLSGLSRPKVGAKGEQRQQLKDLSIQACRLRGWAPIQDDDADALGILDYVAHARTRYREHINWAPGPLFSGPGVHHGEVSRGLRG